jgi:hypothetical protein
MDQSDSAPTDQFVASETFTPAPRPSSNLGHLFSTVDKSTRYRCRPTQRFVFTQNYQYTTPVDKTNVDIETDAIQTPEICPTPTTNHQPPTSTNHQLPTSTIHQPPTFYNMIFPEKIHIVRQGYLPFSSEKIYRFELYVNRILRTVFFSKHKVIEDAYAEFRIKQKIPDTTWENSIAHNDMTNCEDRFNTFKDWPRFIGPSARNLAMAGFSYCNFGDRVRCFWCNIILKDWEPTDEAWSEHKRWSPNCPFIKLCRLNV